MLLFEGDGPDNEVDEPLAWSVAFSRGICNCVAPAHGSPGVMCGRPCAQVIFGESTDAAVRCLAREAVSGLTPAAATLARSCAAF